MIPKQGESENTGGKRIKKSPLVKRRKEEKEKRRGGEKKNIVAFCSCCFTACLNFFLFVLFCLFIFWFFVVFFLKNLTPDIPRSIHFGSPRTMKKFSCLSYSSSSTILTLTVFL